MSNLPTHRYGVFLEEVVRMLEFYSRRLEELLSLIHEFEEDPLGFDLEDLGKLNKEEE